MKQRDVNLLDRPSYQSLLREMRQIARKETRNGRYIDWPFLRTIFIDSVSIVVKYKNSHLYT